MKKTKETVTYSLQLTHNEHKGSWFSKMFRNEEDFRFYREHELPGMQRTAILHEMAYHKVGSKASKISYHEYR